MQLKSEYMCFYMQGRDAKRLRVDVDDIVERVLKRLEAGERVWNAVLAVVDEQTQTFLVDPAKKKAFVRDNEEEITGDASDPDLAWHHFIWGKQDELVSAVEPEVVDAIEESIDGGGGDGDDEDDEEEEEEEEEEEGE